MNTFGILLRSYRYRSHAPGYPERKLSQERLGELLGLELGGGYSGAAVSDWERGMSKIHADQRPVLIGLLKVLKQQGGITTAEEANKLLEAGNYRALDKDEKQLVFPAGHIEPSDQPPLARARYQRWPPIDFLGKLLFASDEEREILLENAKKGPAPSWPRVLVALLNRFTSGWTFSGAFRILLWVWVLLFTWGLITPSLRIPYVDRDDARFALLLYAVGSLVIPLLIGVVTITKNNEFWRQKNLANALVTRLYTHQGASIGFHLAYFAIFTIRLIIYYLHLSLPPWLELIVVILIIISSYAGARLIPYNLWQAYGRLRIADGWLFFIFLLIGPLWGFLFFETYPILLTPIVGFFTILIAVTIFLRANLKPHLRT